ncbi:hypothetical protein Ddye_028358 [Dipteronia dyeriana]|uniref:FAF domain-containing protein n=1 Tax=Dipteronia dyeriana TaxID=168575 RepID=A0AAD9WS87_9ROSI|nr:hypothetical protein Ddye_028358 [Dipteronia dyeriana]
MMSFCRKSVHSFLGLTTTNNFNCNNNFSSFESKPSPTCKHGLGLITTDDTGSSPSHVIESSVLKAVLPSPSPSPVVKGGGGGVFLAKKDPGGIGFIDEVGGGVDGLMSCTESLGFESSDERMLDETVDQLGRRVESLQSSLSPGTKWRKVVERRPKEMKKFPPLLSSFNHHGQPSFFLRPVRKDGRLELTEVRIDRPEILRAYREDGRLRLHLIREDDFFDTTHDDDQFKEEEEDVQQQNYNQEIQQEQQNNQYQEEDEEEIEEKLIMEEEKNHEEWKFPVTGEGYRRCNESMDNYHDHHRNMSHHHHNLHVWSQHYVTTR